jgi:hypothetical protein
MTHTTRHTPIAHVVNVGNPSLILCYTLFMEVKTEELAELLLYMHQSSFAHGTTPLALLSLLLRQLCHVFGTGLRVRRSLSL